MNLMKYFHTCLIAFIMLSCWLNVASAQDETIWMPDPNLRAKVRETLNLAAGTPLTQQAMQGLIELEADRSALIQRQPGSQIVYLTGLEYATNLRSLDLYRNQIVDVGPLANLTELRVLTLTTNLIIDVRAPRGVEKTGKVRSLG